MAVFSAVPPPPELGGTEPNSHDDAQPQPQSQSQQQQQESSHETAPTNGVDIEAWTISALQSLSVSSVARGTGSPLSIPLDNNDDEAKTKEKVKKEQQKQQRPPVTFYDDARAQSPPRRPPSRRDSLKRREALLKGNEGSRQRRRWENDRLLHVPNAIPPEPQDYAPRPTHPVHHVPYKLAAAWELRVRAEVEARNAAAAAVLARRKLMPEGRVPRELCLRAKKTPAVRAWVRSLEEPVRRYLVEREIARETDAEGLRTDDSSESSSGLDSEDDEIVFVGRNGTMRDGGSGRHNAAAAARNVAGQWKKARREERRTGATQDEGMLFDAVGADEDGGAFRRWITHSISEYYGLQSRSVLVGDPKRKVVYVGVKQMKTGRGVPDIRADLPRPLWELC
ncbi:hypothetical protein F4859DRAFT_197980 [Xylaria cf. heliscus]|nr:hypothetical protein F4859DRAFT_197980 [Xylaria cf. heliscus]